MAFFRGRGALGVDIGTASIKVVEMSVEGGRPTLQTYGIVDIANDIVRSESDSAHAKIIDSLKVILKKANTKSKRATTALPGFSVFSAVIELPKMAPSEIASAVKWEARRYVPFPVETMTMDWKVVKEKDQKSVEPKLSKGLPTNGNRVEKIKVLLNAAPRSLVNKYVKIFKGAGLRLMALETEPFALVRSLVGNDNSVVAMVNIGSTATEVSVIEKGLPVLNKSADIGGRAITNAVANSLNISHSRAEQFKRDLGTHGDSNEVPPSIKPILQSIANEVQNSFLIYQNSGGKPINKVIMSGGSSNLSMLKNFLSETLKMEVFFGDPWARVAYPKELKETLQSLSPVFGVAVGLAMRNS